MRDGRCRFSIVRDDIGPLARVGSGHNSDNRFRVTDVEDFVRDARRNENEIASGVLHAVFAPVTELVSHMTRENVEHHLEVDVDVRVGDAGRRNCRDVHGKLSSGNVLGRQPDLVVDVVPVPNVTSGAHGPYAGVSFNV